VVHSLYDVVIIGAGPAGATLARLVGAQRRVLLVDKRPSFDAAHGKCCGGLLAPDAQRLISKLGLGLPRHILVEPQIFVVRAIDLPRKLSCYYQRFYLNMDRPRFDAWLLSLVSPAVEVRLGCQLVSFSRQKDHLTLTLREEGGFRQVAAKLLVGADGAFSKVRRLAFPKRPGPNAYIAIQEQVEAQEPLPYFSALFDPEITDFYCWTIPKDDHLLIGAALRPRAEAAARFGRLREKLREYGYRFGKVVRREGAWIVRPRRFSDIITTGPGLTLVGEAAGFISPSSAEGLSYAMRSALYLAEELNSSLEDIERRYHRRTLSLRKNLFIKNLKSPFMFNPFLRRLIMQTGLNSLEMYRPPAPAKDEP